MYETPEHSQSLPFSADDSPHPIDITPQQPFRADAYTSEGQLWWKLEYHPGTKRKFGAERKIASWLHSNKEVGDRFTIRELRSGVGKGDLPNDQEHFNRRMRELRKLGWRLLSAQDDAQLRTDEYRIAQKGWHPASGLRPKTSGQISGPLRRNVLERDGRRCVICGVGSREEYPDPPTEMAVMSIGHRVPRHLGGSDEISNLQVECKRCNETARDQTGIPETLGEVNAAIRGLKREEKRSILTWLQAGRRTRSKVDELYDRARRLNPDERAILEQLLRKATESTDAAEKPS